MTKRRLRSASDSPQVSAAGTRTVEFDERSFRHRVVAIFVATAAFVAADSYFVLSESVHRGQIFGRDFIAYWGASLLVDQGRYEVLYDFARYNAFLDSLTEVDLAIQGFSYPPHGLFLLRPRAKLPYLWAYGIWCLATLLLYLVAVGAPDWSRNRLLHALLAPTTLLILNLGQNGLLTGALFLAGMRLLNRRPVLAGIAIGLLSFKPQLGPLIPFALLAGRLWIPFLAASATVAAMVGGSLLAAGVEPWDAYLGQDVVAAALGIIERGSGTMTIMMQTPFMAARILGFDLPVAYGLQALLATVALAAVIRSFRFGTDRTLQIAVLAIATLLVSPYMFNYDMAAALGALVLVFAQFRVNAPSLREQYLYLTVWFLPILGMYLSDYGLPIGPLLLLALLGLLLRRLGASRGG